MKLKACPFCGREDVKMNRIGEKIWCVTCKCGLEAPKDSVSKTGAARIWNRRRPPQSKEKT
jgi:ribosomal protein L37AE/L43A